MKSSPSHTRPVTQSQIARAAGISQAAVSAILSGSGVLNVSEETRENVLNLAARMGYVARRAVGAAQRSGNGRDPQKKGILLIENIPTREPADPWVTDAYANFMGRIVAATSEHLSRHGMTVSVLRVGRNTREITRQLADHDIGGILWHATDRDPGLLHWVASRYPLVLLNREFHTSAPCDIVSVDQGKNISLATEYLWSAGHRRIATFGHCPGNSVFQRRIEAYKRFVTEKQIRDYREFQALPDEQDYPAARKIENILRTWRDLGPEAPTALIMSDAFALRLLTLLRKETDIRIPDDLSLVGIDNTSPCALMDPPLTSMEEPFDEMCAEAVELLLRRIARRDAPSRSVQIAPRLVERGSVSIKPDASAAIAAASPPVAASAN
ncbi:transcriptional regulator [Opitutaceae bacterium TAV1]|nr:transcriptional regulator [Opitutaceae bacterium TAV1]